MQIIDIQDIRYQVLDEAGKLIQNLKQLLIIQPKKISINRSMGTKQSQAQINSYFNINEWSQQFFDSGARILANKRNPQLQIQQNTMMISNQRQMELAQELLALRKQDAYLVAVLHYQIFNQVRLSQIRNQGAFSGLLYTERIPLRLNQVKRVPFPDILHLYAQSIYGFEKLSKYFGYFIVNQNCIGINPQNVAKVWHNPNFASIHPYQTAFSEQDMLSSILDSIQKCIDASTMPKQDPSFKYFILKQQAYLSFELAKRKLFEYCKYYNNGVIPKQCRCATSRGGGGITNMRMQAQPYARSRQDSPFGSQTGNQQYLQRSIVQQLQINNPMHFGHQMNTNGFANGFTQNQHHFLAHPNPRIQPVYQTPIVNNPFEGKQINTGPQYWPQNQMQNFNNHFNPQPQLAVKPVSIWPNNQMVNNITPSNVNGSFQSTMHQQNHQIVAPSASLPINNRPVSNFSPPEAKHINPFIRQSIINPMSIQRQNRLQLKSSPPVINKFSSKISQASSSIPQPYEIIKPKSIPTNFQLPSINRSYSHDRHLISQFHQSQIARQRSNSQFNKSVRSNSPQIFFNHNPVPIKNPLKISQQFAMNNQFNTNRQVHRQLRPASIKQSIQGINLNIPMTSSKIKSEEEHLQSLGHNFTILQNTNSNVNQAQSTRSSNTFNNSSFNTSLPQVSVYQSQTIPNFPNNSYVHSLPPLPINLAISTDDHEVHNQSDSLASPSFGRVQSSDSDKWLATSKFVMQNNRTIPTHNQTQTQNTNPSQTQNQAQAQKQNAPAFHIQNIQSFKELQARMEPKQLIMSPRPDLDQESKQNQQATLNNVRTRAVRPEVERPKSPIQIGGVSNQSFSSIGAPGFSRQTTDKLFHDVRQSESINNSTRNFYNNFLNSDYSEIVQLSSPLDYRLKNKEGAKIDPLILEQTEPMDNQSDTQSKHLEEGGTSWDLMEKLKMVSMTSKQDPRNFVKSGHKIYEATYKNSTPSKIEQEQQVKKIQKKKRTNSDQKQKSGSKQFNKDVAKLGFYMPVQDSSSSQKGTHSQKSIKQATTYEQTTNWSPTYKNANDIYTNHVSNSYKENDLQPYKPKEQKSDTNKEQQQNAYENEQKYPSNDAYGGHSKKKSYTDMYLYDYMQSQNISSINPVVESAGKNNGYIQVISSYKIDNPSYSITSSIKPSIAQRYESNHEQQNYKFDWDPELLADMETKAFSSAYD